MFMIIGLCPHDAVAVAKVDKTQKKVYGGGQDGSSSKKHVTKASL